MMSLKKTYTLIDFSMRIYIAYFLVEYGVSKITGDMFNNTSMKILNTPLKDVDMFHLTWFWFQKNTLLSYIIGIFQIASAVLLIINRTVLIGVLIAFPIFLNILIIDIYCVKIIELEVRVVVYILFLFQFCLHRRKLISKIISEIFLNVSDVSLYRVIFSKYAITIPFIITTLFVIEFLLIKLFSCLIK